MCWLLYVSQPCNFNTELTTPPLLTYGISIPELKTVSQDCQLADDKKVMNEQSVGRFLLGSGIKASIARLSVHSLYGGSRN